MELLKLAAEIDAKRFLRVSWVLHLGAVIAATIVFAAVMPERMGPWLSALPLLLGAIALEGAAAAGGSSLKRVTESLKIKAGEKGGVAAHD